MSDEQRKDEETEVEGHAYPPKYGANDEPATRSRATPSRPSTARTTSRATRSRATPTAQVRRQR